MNEFKGMVDVAGGPMTLKQVEREIVHYMWMYKPSRLVVDIKFKKGYYATLWIPEKDFKRR